MSTDAPLDLNRVDQEIRMNELKEEACELAGGDMHVWENPDCQPEIMEQFWNHVVAYEKTPRSCDFSRLEDMGVAFPRHEPFQTPPSSALQCWANLEQCPPATI